MISNDFWGLDKLLFRCYNKSIPNERLDDADVHRLDTDSLFQSLTVLFTVDAGT